MKNRFSFENLFKKMPHTSIPREFIYFGIGIVLIVIIGLIVGNMYLNEMLFFEGQEKSIQIFTEEELREYGFIYKDMSLDFEKEIGYMIEDYANRKNRFGEKIHYGVFNYEHTTDDIGKIKIHNNGQNVNKADNEHMSDYDDAKNTFEVVESYVESDEFKNGVTINYSKTKGKNDGESNFKDILTVVSMMMDQKQTKDNSSINIKSKIPNLIKKLYKLSHTYKGESSELYSCEKGCRVLYYYCNEIDNKYVNTGIDLNPFEITPHDEFENFDSSTDFEIVEPKDECFICGHNGKGCVEDSELCFHGTSEEEKPHKTTPTECEEGHYHPVFICSYEGDGDHDCSGSEIGCGGYYQCDGHKHYNCPGHFYVCCSGHTDINVEIKTMYIEEMLAIIKSGYNVGGDDE